MELGILADRYVHLYEYHTKAIGSFPLFIKGNFSQSASICRSRWFFLPYGVVNIHAPQLKKNSFSMSCSYHHSIGEYQS